ncbi:MAG TPA: hypothetical protein VIK89_06190, partial [Cytophagaceae bacterium]
VKGQGTTEEKKKRKKKYFPKQKGQGLKNHGFPGGKVASGTSVSGGKKDKTQQDTDKTSRGKKSKRRPEFTESVYRKRENVKKS